MNKTVCLLLTFVGFVMLFFSAIFGVLAGILFADTMDVVKGKDVIIYGVMSLFLGVLGSILIAKINAKIKFWYLFITFTIAGLVGGMSRFFIPHNDGLMLVVIALSFVVFFLVGRIVNK